LAATLYAALSGSIPEDGLVRAIRCTKLTPLRSRKPDISLQTAFAIEKAMEIDPANRYPTAEEFKKSLILAYESINSGEKLVIENQGSKPIYSEWITMMNPKICTTFSGFQKAICSG
jgi:hypothetical protein